MWSQADHNEIKLQPMDDYGWKITNSALTIDWDSEENIEAVQQRVPHVLIEVVSAGLAAATTDAAAEGKTC